MGEKKKKKMKVFFALLCALFFLTVTSRSVKRCRVVVVKSWLVRRSRKVKVSKPVVRVRFVKGKKRVCNNKRVKVRYLQKYPVKIRQKYPVRVRYQRPVKVWKNYKVRCQKTKLRRRLVVWYVPATRPCIKRRKKCVTAVKRVPYKTTCRRKVIVPYRVKVPKKVRATCYKRVKYPVKVKTRRRCTKYRYKTVHNGKWYFKNNCWHKQWVKKRIPYKS